MARRWMMAGWIGFVFGFGAGPGCAPTDPSTTPSGPGGAASVRIAPVHTLRDLVAVTEGPVVEVSWRSDAGETAAGSVLPADRLWPGETWTAIAETGDGVVHDAITVPEPPGGNVLVVLIDDVGVDKVSAYGAVDAPPTPTLDALADEGVRFTRAYTSPVCSPTRGILLTGRHARRTGLGWIADTGSRDYALPLAALTLPEALSEARTAVPWSDGAVGKWHMAGPEHPDVLTHPLDSGFSWFSGLVGNPMYADGYGYDRWEHNDNGVLSERTGYLTTATIDDALDRIEAMPEPWMLYLPLSAAHGPWTPPPDELLSEPLPADADDRVAYDAVLTAMDLELGRMLDTVDPGVLDRTTVIVMGDNGTPSQAIVGHRDPDRQKHTLYEGGVNVPLIVTGPHVGRRGAVSDALVHVADIFPTVAEIAGVPLSGPDDALVVHGPDGPVALDGRSWLPLLADPDAPFREHVFAEAFHPNGPGPDYGIDRRMVRDETFKLVRAGDVEMLFAMDAAPGDDPDGADLLAKPIRGEALDAFERLSYLLDHFEDTVVYEGR